MEIDIKLRITLEAKEDFGSTKKGETIVLYNEVFCVNSGIAFWPIDKDVWVVKSVDRFTGLKDSKRTAEYPNGQGIYERDVLGFYTSLKNGYFKDGVFVKLLVCFGEHNTTNNSLHKAIGFYLKSTSESSLTYKLRTEDIEVIGNINEKPELLKQLEK